MGWYGRDWIHLAQGRYQWKDFVGNWINFLVTKNFEKFLSSWATIDFLIRARLHGVTNSRDMSFATCFVWFEKRSLALLDPCKLRWFRKQFCKVYFAGIWCLVVIYVFGRSLTAHHSNTTFALSPSFAITLGSVIITADDILAHVKYWYPLWQHTSIRASHYEAMQSSTQWNCYHSALLHWNHCPTASILYLVLLVSIHAEE
jgi:hypothetical protein